MVNYLASIALRLEREDPAVLIWEVDEALEELRVASSPLYGDRARSLHNLVRFCKFESLATWLRDERAVVEQARDFAQVHGLADVARILDDALAGDTQGELAVTFSRPGLVPQRLEAEVGELTKFDGKDWGSTDVALSFVMDTFMVPLLHALGAAADELDIPAPNQVRQLALADARVEAEIAQGHSAADLFQRLVSARGAHMLAGSWEDFEARSIERAVPVPMVHRANPPASPRDLLAMQAKYGNVAADLLAIHALHDGAELFQHAGDTGFCFAPISAWDGLHRDAVTWAEEVSWQDEKSHIPRYLYTAIAFGYIPGDSERWLLITEGDLAGSIMLSDTDLINNMPRFTSLAEFVGTLIMDAARVLNVGGYVHYAVGEEELVPIRYVEQGVSPITRPAAAETPDQSGQ